ncbi:hypothetical protein JD844_023625 [Phrynosoma platyrhinos]|uniref:Uncharacterized protein n=1 Tax=Phrynosoma platyrhinos TaxID=52577 RepID=A0ABQ7SX99_PHRPL|nr:hypothetical protein JD844_023625 [Phrynosoma platyrhinos]
MMSILMNTIIFEDCRNQWSVSRPLLGLILLNEKIHTTRFTQNMSVFRRDMAEILRCEGVSESSSSDMMS